MIEFHGTWTAENAGFGPRLKVCSKCHKAKGVVEFNKNATRSDGLQVWCRECSNKRRTQQHKAKPQQQRQYNRDMLNRNRAKLLEHLLSHPCVDCGEDDVVVLEFDHVRGEKHKDVSRLLCYSWKRVEQEILKCEVVCANCHKRRTYTRAGSYRVQGASSKGQDSGFSSPECRVRVPPLLPPLSKEENDRLFAYVIGTEGKSIWMQYVHRLFAERDYLRLKAMGSSPTRATKEV